MQPVQFIQKKKTSIIKKKHIFFLKAIKREYKKLYISNLLIQTIKNQYDVTIAKV